MQRLDILHPSIDDYLLDIIPERDAVLTEMETHARANRFPIVGPLVGRVLHQLVLLTNPTRIFEMGSGFGYSAYWMAKALQKPEASIICTDGSQENADSAVGYLARGGIADRIDYRVGNALEIIDETEGEFDIIYNDIDKDGYPEAFHKAIPRLRSGGLFITDNMLWMGRVVTQEPGGPPEGLDEREQWFHAATIGVKELTRLLYSSSDVFTTIIPLRDGVSVAVKR
ncbi:MAG: O-methyltransferase [Candidatus Poribacteria bacterium]|nr:O-methyltransferase [Candidatus Poribacteria bacterium]